MVIPNWARLLIMNDDLMDDLASYVVSVFFAQPMTWDQAAS